MLAVSDLWAFPDVGTSTVGSTRHYLLMHSSSTCVSGHTAFVYEYLFERWVLFRVPARVCALQFSYDLRSSWRRMSQLSQCLSAAP